MSSVCGVFGCVLGICDYRLSFFGCVLDFGLETDLEDSWDWWFLTGELRGVLLIFRVGFVGL